MWLFGRISRIILQEIALLLPVGQGIADVVLVIFCLLLVPGGEGDPHTFIIPELVADEVTLQESVFVFVVHPHVEVDGIVIRVFFQGHHPDFDLAFIV